MKKTFGISVVGLGILVAQGCATEMAGNEDIATTQSAISLSATYELKGVHSNRCIDVTGVSTSDGANIQLWDCNGGGAQKFKFEDMGGGYYRVRNVNSNKCLDAYAFGTGDGVNFVQWACSTGYNQQFTVTDTGGGKFSLINRNSGKAVDAAGWGTSNGTNIQQWTYGGGDNQKFYLNQLSSGSTTTTTTTSTTTTASSIPQECFVNQRIDMMCAELAVAMAKEIGELNPLRDLAVVNDRVVLSQEGLSRCSNGCYHVQGILEWQDGTRLPQTVFTSEAFRTNLVSQWYEQQNFEADLKMNHPDWLPGAHTLSLVNQGPAYCGTNYTFNVNWQCSSSDIAFEAESYASKRAGGSDNFTLSNGSMVCGPDDGTAWTSGWGSSAPKLSYNVNFPSSGTYYVWVRAYAANGSNDSMHAGIDGQENTTADKITTGTYGSTVWTNQTMDGAPATINVGSAGNHSFDLYAREDGIQIDKIVLTKNANYTPGSSTSSGCTTDAATIENRMKFFRPNNTVIDFTAGSGQMTIDPTGSLIDDGSGSGSGSCTDSCTKFVASGLEGACCMCNGLTGTFQKTSTRKMECL